MLGWIYTQDTAHTVVLLLPIRCIQIDKFDGQEEEDNDDDKKKKELLKMPVFSWSFLSSSSFSVVLEKYSESTKIKRRATEK